MEYFKFGIDNGINNVTSSHAFSGVPTSRQSSLWEGGDWLRFPNFNYLHMEFIPMVQVQLKKKVKLSAGVGIFYGVLLNQKDLVFGRSFFPEFDWFFDPPFNVTGQVSYRKHDLGWIPKIAVSVPLTEKIQLGFSCKTYVSQIALFTNNDGGSSFRSLHTRRFNANWLVFAYGLELSYLLHKNNK